MSVIAQLKTKVVITDFRNYCKTVDNAYQCKFVFCGMDVAVVEMKSTTKKVVKKGLP
jgi:hypothetical protein